MDCRRFDRLIDAYLDGELSGSLLAEFHAHRLACRRCGRAVSMLEAAGDVIAMDRSEPAVPGDLTDRILSEFPAAVRAGRRPAWLVRLTAGAAGLAAAAAILLAVVLSQQFPPTAGHTAGHKVSGMQAVLVDREAQVRLVGEKAGTVQPLGAVLSDKLNELLDEMETTILWVEFEP